MTDDGRSEVDSSKEDTDPGSMAGPIKHARRRKRVHQRTLPSGTVQLRVRGTAADGRPFDRSLCFSEGALADRERAARAAAPGLHRWAEEVEAGRVMLEESLTVAEAFEKLRKLRLLRDRDSFRSLLAGPVRRLRGADLRELDDARMRAWIDSLERDGYSASYQRGAYFFVRNVVGMAIEKRWIARIPWSAVHKWLPGERETRTREALAPSAMVSVFDAARQMDREGRSSGALALRIELAHHLACRPIEIARMGPINLIDREGFTLCRWQAAKNNPVREVALPPDLAERLRAWWSGLSAPAKRVGVFFPLRGQNGRWRSRVLVKTGYETGQLFTGAESKRLRELSGVCDLIPYEVRHTGATEAAEALGMSAPEVQKFLEHATLATTARYVKPRLDVDKASRLSAPRPSAQRAPKPVTLVDVSDSSSREATDRPGIAKVSRVHAGDVTTSERMKSADPPRGRVVDAGETAMLLERLPALCDAIAGAGGADALVCGIPSDALAAALDDVSVLAGLSLGARGPMIEGLRRALEVAVSRRGGHAPPVAGQERGADGRKAEGLRLVR